MNKNLIYTSLISTILTISLFSLFAFNNSESNSNQIYSEDLPIGSIIIWAGEASPNNNWEICRGQRKLKSANHQLYEAIGGYWNKDVGANEDFFQLPDLRGVFLRGVNGLRRDQYRDTGARNSITGNSQFDNTVGSFQIDKFEEHNHGGGNHNHKTQVPNSGASFEHHQINSRKAKVNNTATSSTYSGNIINFEGGSETRPKNAYVNYIIKVK